MATQKMQLVDWLDDLCVRFIINLPQEELESVARICFQVEEAQWFYEDFVRPIDPTLPSLNLKQFCLRIFRHCPLLSAFSDEQHMAAYQEFLGYKTRVPVRGAIMLNHDMDKVLLVKGWKASASWSFPRGKINKDEPDLDCAIREVYEETGYDIKLAGLAPSPEDVKAIDVTMREQHMRLFVFRGVPEDTNFEAKTRKEISKIQWYKLSDLPTLKKKQAGHGDGQETANPNKFYMVAPFLGPLKKWINQQKKIDAQQALYEEGDMPSEAFVEAHESASDAAAGLKRLLSVQPASDPLQAFGHGQMAPEQQANSLLQMLRGGPGGGPSLQQQFQQTSAPLTPMDQIIGFPQQPHSPHAHHVRESPFATAQPPPVFSPQHSHLRPQSSGSAQAQPLSNNQQNLLSMMQQPAQQPPPRSDLLQAFFGQPRAQPSQTPVAVVAGVEPQASLNNHAMGLLNAFKAGPGPGKSSALLNAAKQAPLPRNPHQNTLLDLLRGPSSSLATPPPPTAGLAETLDALVLDQAATSEAPASRPPPPVSNARKPSASSMINRTLPKARKPSAPSMDADNFPTLGSAPPPPKARPQAGAAPLPVVNMLTKPVTILARPEQPALQQQGPQQESRSKQTSTPTPVAILQRPASRTTETPSPQGQSKPAFQPQILKRGEAVASAIPPTQSPPAQAPTHAQRDALLSLFAPAQPRTSTPEEAADPLSLHTRLGSIGSRPVSASRHGSMASTDLRSPETPLEKRGFLMDYLDNVVKGAK